MLTTSPIPLSLEAFHEFGEFSNFCAPSGEAIGKDPITFYRDMCGLSLGNSALASFSVCTVAPRPLVVTTAEFHSYTGEALIFLDASCYFFVAPATPRGESFPSQKIKVFEVPRGYGLFLKPGVWHHAHFVKEGKVANVLVTLPPRTYVNDCYCIELQASEQVAIEAY